MAISTIASYSLLKMSPKSPSTEYDPTTTVQYFIDLFVKPTEDSVAIPKTPRELWPDIVAESVVSVRYVFPSLTVLTNTSCNLLVETFLLALSIKDRERLLGAAVHVTLACRIPLGESWTGHLEYTQRLLIRFLESFLGYQLPLHHRIVQNTGL